MAQFELQIDGGPGKFDLMNGLFQRGATIMFRVTQKVSGSTVKFPHQEIVAHVNMVQQEDGSCESWNLQGWVESFAGYKPCDFRAYYRTKYSGSGAGCMTITTK